MKQANNKVFETLHIILLWDSYATENLMKSIYVFIEFGFTSVIKSFSVSLLSVLINFEIPQKVLLVIYVSYRSLPLSFYGIAVCVLFLVDGL